MTPLDAMRLAYTRLKKIDPIPLDELTALTDSIAELESAEPVAWDVSGCLYRTKIPPMTHEQAERWTYTPLFTHPSQSRDSIIEECAKVVELSISHATAQLSRVDPESCAAAIRALKGK